MGTNFVKSSKRPKTKNGHALFLLLRKKARLRNFWAKEFDANFTPTFRIVRLFDSKQRCHVVRQIPHIVLPFNFAVMQNNGLPDAFSELFFEAHKRFDAR